MREYIFEIEFNSGPPITRSIRGLDKCHAFKILIMNLEHELPRVDFESVSFIVVR